MQFKFHLNAYSKVFKTTILLNMMDRIYTKVFNLIKFPKIGKNIVTYQINP